MLLSMVIQAWAIANTIIKQLLQKNGNTTNRSEKFSESHLKIFFILNYSGETVKGMTKVSIYSFNKNYSFNA